MLRALGFVCTITFPAVYTALLLYHRELVPARLLFAISAAQRGVPLPIGWETLLLLLVLEALKEALLEQGMKGMTLSQVQGCGNSHGWKEYYRGTEVLLNMVPKIQVAIVVADDAVEDVIAAVVSVAKTGEVGDGKIFVQPVEEAVRILTGDRGEAAL